MLLVIYLISIITPCEVWAQDPPLKDNPRIYPPQDWLKPDRKTFSFYQQPLKKAGHYTIADWRYLIDSVWGEGMPTTNKLIVFDSFWSMVDEPWGGFPNHSLNWDSVRAVYRPEIAAGVSRGRFYGIMSHLGFLLQEVHSYVNDRGIDSSAIIDGKIAQPGIPVYFPGDYGITTAGMGVAPMPDSSLFVYRAQQGHPLGRPFTRD
jgi:hypothetical protein